MDKRIKFISNKDIFFSKLLELSGRSLAHVAQRAGVSERTIRSWRTGTTTAPYHLIREWSLEFKIPIPAYIEIDLSAVRRAAASEGGKRRIRIHGNPGTIRGRSLGGNRSVAAQNSNVDSPFSPKNIRLPGRSAEVAELVGIVLGDGGITDYQLVIYSSLADDADYAIFVKELLEKLFGCKVQNKTYPANGVIRTICSRKNVVTYLQKLDLHKGNKVAKQVQVPVWVQNNTAYAHACLRGLIDTDGCVYQDTHTVQGKQYSSTCIAFTNVSIPLIDFVEKQWRILGYTPTRSGRDIRLRRRNDVYSYTKTVGFHNPKHLRKIGV